jgi:hypothetical protein
MQVTSHQSARTPDRLYNFGMKDERDKKKKPLEEANKTQAT